MIRRMEEKKRKTVYLIIIALGALTYFMNLFLNQHKLFLDTSICEELGCTDTLINGRYVQQNIYTDHDMEMVLQLCVITWNADYDRGDFVNISIIDLEEGKTVLKKGYRADSFSDHILSGNLIMEGAHLKAGRWYGIRIESNIRDEKKPLAVAYVENKWPETTNTVFDGKPVDYNLSLKIWE